MGILRVLLVLPPLALPAWWAAGRICDERASPLFRGACAVGMALLAFLSGVNLLGRATGNSLFALSAWCVASAAASVWLLRSRPRSEFLPGREVARWEWLLPVALAVVVGLPQWILAVSSNYWDEANASAIHLSAPSQFAEGVFPPRHNALPGVAIKYHYAFVILSGTLTRLLGTLPNYAIDVASTSLWLFVFLFVWLWLRELEFEELEAGWGAFATLLGGGLAWVYLPRLESYGGIEKYPPASAMTHHYEAGKGFFINLLGAANVPSQHLRNGDGTLSALAWDIAAQFQQHAVSLGIAVALVCLWLFTAWRRRPESRVLLAANVIAFGVGFLAHAVFGMVAAATAGARLLWTWLKRPTREGFIDGALFGAGVVVLGLLHGGMTSMGPQYGGGGFTTFRRVLGYWSGGLAGFFHWNAASFGLLLVLGLAALVVRDARAQGKAPARHELYQALAVFLAISYVIPNATFYSSETYGVEQYTEISKFFFCVHFALALLSAYGLEALRSKGLRPWMAAPLFVAAAVSPVAYCWANSVGADGKWLGFYRSPYHLGSIEEQSAAALRSMKKSNRDVYFDASADERRSGYLSEMLVFAGSVFTLTPSAYERTGIGYRLAQDVVARQFVENGRVARLRPGALEHAGVTWFYSRPLQDYTLAPILVRSRFRKATETGILVVRFSAGARVLYSVEKPTQDLDRDIERWWTPLVVAQTKTECTPGGRGELAFYDYVAQKILCGPASTDLPDSARDETASVLTGKFPFESRSTFHVGRLSDTVFRLGRSIDDIVETSDWVWRYQNSVDKRWQPEYSRWAWDSDIPVVADIDSSGRSRHLAYRFTSKEWIGAPWDQLPGPKVDRGLLPLPFAGRFLAGSKGDLGLWSLMDGKATIKSLTTGAETSFRLGGTYGFVLVPADYDGDGRQEVAVYNQGDKTWYWMKAPDGAYSSVTFGSKTCVPAPYDYDGDGKVDLGCWEPAAGRIDVSMRTGRVDRVVKVPPHSIPVFVNMY